jgi:predicted dehydrogenase
MVVDVNADAARAVGAQHGCRWSVNWQDAVIGGDADIVVVATTNNWLAPIAVAALQSGKHVLSEKPLGRSPVEAAEIVQAALLAGRLLKAGFNHRHHPAIWEAHQMFAAGAIGYPFFVRCRYGHGGRPGYETEWRANPVISGGGELLDQGVHVADLLRWFLGDFSEAFGYVDSYFWKSKYGADDNAFALFRTAAGQTASLHSSWTQWKNTFAFELYGSEGYLVIDGLGGSYGTERLLVGRRRPESGPPDEEVYEFALPDCSWGLEWNEFRSAIAEGREPIGNGDDGLQAMKMIEAVYESARLHAPVRICRNVIA